VQFLSSYWLIKSQDLNITLLKKGQAASCRFSKEFCESLGNILTNRKEGIKIQRRIVHPLTIFKEWCKFNSFLVLNGQEVINSLSK
jgi:hypothetical protein